MASTEIIVRAHPKRKRAEVSYCEISSDEGQVDDEYSNLDEELTTRAKRKRKTSRNIIADKPLSKRKIFPFTSLPAELKNQIYALALTEENSIFIISKTKHYRRTVQRAAPGSILSGYVQNRHHWIRKEPPWTEVFAEVTLPSIVPNILLLNRAIHAETQPILYAGNTFAVEDTTAMHAFLATIGPKNRATITDLTIKGWGLTKSHKTFNYPAFTMLVGAVNLRRLRLDCKVSWGGLQTNARRLYRDSFHWLEAVGSATGKFDAALDLIEFPEEQLITCPYVYLREVALSPEDQGEEIKVELRRLLSRRR